MFLSRGFLYLKIKRVRLRPPVVLPLIPRPKHQYVIFIKIVRFSLKILCLSGIIQTAIEMAV